MRTVRINRAAFLLALLLSLPAHAAPVTPGGAEPSRAREQIAPLAPEPPPAALPAPKAPQAVAPEGADKITFTLASVTVDGMTAYAPAAMAPLYARMTGKTVSFKDLYTLAAAMTAKYRNDGYILSQVIVPPQEIEGGHVHLRAVEGFVDNISLKGDGDPARLLPFAAAVKTSRPLKNADLERALLLLNDLPGVTAEAVLGKSAHTPGAADLTLVIAKKRVDAAVETDNRGARYMGPLQATAVVTINDALGQLESLGVQVAGTPESWPRREMTSTGITWTQSLGHDGLKFSLSGTVTETRPGLSLAQFDSQGTARAAGAALSYPFIRSRQKNLSGTLKLDYSDSRRSDNLGLPKTEDRTRVARAGLTAQFTDPAGGADMLNVELSQGLGILNATKKGDADITRADGDPGFFKGTFTLARTQGIGAWEAYTAFTGQKSSTLLLAGEEFGLGGAQFGSAYDASELTGEDGLAMRLEMRRLLQTKIPVRGLQFYAFYDLGKVWNYDDAVPRHRQASLADLGFGFRAMVTEKISASVEAAQPLTRPVASTGTEDTRLFFMLSARF